MNRPVLETQLDAVLYFMTKLDVDMVSTLLDDNRTYQDFDKSLFIRKLGDLFFEFKELGDFLLLTERGKCYGCSCGTGGYTFIGNKSKAYIDIVFATDENGNVLDMFECSDFYTKRSKLKRNQRLYLDKYVDFELEEDDEPWFGDDDEFDDDSPF